MNDTKTPHTVQAKVDTRGLSIGGVVFCAKVSLAEYVELLGKPDRTIEAGPPAPAGHRNNLFHVFDRFGFYLSEHHASRLIESVNFIFDISKCPFANARAFPGQLQLYGESVSGDTTEEEISGFNRDLPGEYSIKGDGYWVGVSAIGRRGKDGKRRKPRYIARVSVCF